MRCGDTGQSKQNDQRYRRKPVRCQVGKLENGVAWSAVGWDKWIKVCVTGRCDHDSKDRALHNFRARVCLCVSLCRHSRVAQAGAHRRPPFAPHRVTGKCQFATHSNDSCWPNHGCLHTKTGCCSTHTYLQTSCGKSVASPRKRKENECYSLWKLALTAFFP